MTAARPIQEEELHALVDGGLDAKRRDEIERVLAGDPALSARMALWRQQAALLREATGFKTREPVPDRLNVARLMEQRATPPRPGVRRRGIWQAAAACLLLSLGAGGGWLAHGIVPPAVRSRFDIEALALHSTYAEADSARPALRTGELATLVAWLSDNLHGRVLVADLSTRGYTLIGAQIVPSPFGRSGMLFYRGPGEQRVTILIQPDAQDYRLPIRPVRAARIAGYTWVKRGMAYGLMVGRLDDPDAALPPLQKIADFLCDGPSV